MKEVEQIVYDSIQYEIPPNDYNLLEIQCFLDLKKITTMYYNKQVSQENAGKIKQKILSNYKKQYKEYEFEENMFKEHIQNIKETETERTKLRKILNREEEWKNRPNGEGIEEAFDLAISIIQKVFKGEFIEQ